MNCAPSLGGGGGGGCIQIGTQTRSRMIQLVFDSNWFDALSAQFNSIQYGFDLKNEIQLLFIAIENFWWWFHVIDKEPSCFSGISMISFITF